MCWYVYMKKTMHRRESNRPGRLFSRLLQQGRENELISIQRSSWGLTANRQERELVDGK